MVAKQLRHRVLRPEPSTGLTPAGLGSSRRSDPYSRCVVGINPAEGRSASEGGDEPPRLPFRADGPDHPKAHSRRAPNSVIAKPTTSSLRLAVHCQSRFQGIDPAAPVSPAPRTPLDDSRPDTWTRTADQATRPMGPRGQPYGGRKLGRDGRPFRRHLDLTSTRPALSPRRRPKERGRWHFGSPRRGPMALWALLVTRIACQKSRLRPARSQSGRVPAGNPPPRPRRPPA